jgi:hypothetical protein
MVLVYTTVISEHEKAIKCNFKPGLIKRSIDLDKEDVLQRRRKIILPPAHQ